MIEGLGLTDYLPFMLRRASLLESSTLRRLQRLAGVPPGYQYDVLLALRQAPNGMYVQRLSQVSSILQPTITKTLDAMERDRLVTREHGGVLPGDRPDRRRVLVRLTPAGAAQATKAAGVAFDHMTAIQKAAPMLTGHAVLDALEAVGEVPVHGNL